MSHDPPVVAIYYKNSRFEVAFGLRDDDHESGGVGIDEAVGGMATAIGILLSRVALLDPDTVGPGKLDKLKDSFWEDVTGVMDMILAQDGTVKQEKAK